MSAYLGSVFRVIKLSNSIAVGSGLLGLMYGISCYRLGLPIEFATLSSLFVFTGAAQFAVLPLIEQSAGLFAVMLSVTLTSSRLLLMSASLSSHLSKASVPQILVSLPILTDGSWAYTIAETDDKRKLPTFLVSGIWILLNWVVGSALGFVAASAAPERIVEAMGFSGVIAILALTLLVTRAVPQGRDHHWVVGATISAVVSMYGPLWLAILSGFAGGSVVAMIFTTREESA